MGNALGQGYADLLSVHELNQSQMIWATWAVILCSQINAGGFQNPRKHLPLDVRLVKLV